MDRFQVAAELTMSIQDFSFAMAIAGILSGAIVSLFLLKTLQY